jgi:hypothetical protein
MITLKRFILIFVSFAMLVPVLNSCKKGDEDPFFSIYSRKHRLCHDWKFSYYKKILQHNDSIISYEFDGASMHKIIGIQSYYSAATMEISFDKSGNYIWEETISNDTSVYTYTEEGSWYFSGGGDDSDTKYKELLAMQKNKVTETLQADGTNTTTNYTGSGNLDAIVYKIIKLANQEVKFEYKVETNNIQVTPAATDFKAVTIEMNLKRR